MKSIPNSSKKANIANNGNNISVGDENPKNYDEHVNLILLFVTNIVHFGLIVLYWYVLLVTQFFEYYGKHIVLLNANQSIFYYLVFHLVIVVLLLGSYYLVGANLIFFGTDIVLPYLYTAKQLFVVLLYVIFILTLIIQPYIWLPLEALSIAFISSFYLLPLHKSNFSEG